MACLDQNLELVKFLVNQGADINIPIPKIEDDSVLIKVIPAASSGVF
ncbi:ankyrin repeat domain-containing protein [Rickettsia endosymbiont of Gonocerus acuteangulatus]